ncbi:glycosyltransferase family 4 protein [Alicyclobacillus pomorum]|uniref:glycosyltransferase family 4 protein n=1 Tax=Alicyclobacillus pomorum TaxID=204470 RepID=UPI0003FC6E03|nr:glycosyltransferase family 4 protein [Alicyclobacillus pomorum]
MRITFVLPGFSGHPIGGFKIVYEYASRLQARGHQVTVVHPRRLEKGNFGVVDQIKRILWPLKFRLKYGGRVPWLEVHRGVRLLLIPDLDETLVPDGDAIFATAWQTAPPVMRLPRTKGAKFYLIQHYETWAGPKDKVDATWRMPFHKIVIAKWLYDLGVRFGETSRMTYIPNALDFDVFHVTLPIHQRDRFHVAMLYHEAEWKGSHDGITALTAVKHNIPQLRATLFGVPERGSNIPEWVEYVREPSREQLVQIYNHASVFLQPSWTEGWGLTGAEAMACGCALVSTENQGVMDFAEHEKTALLSPVRNPQALADSLTRLLADDELRREIAYAGNRRIREFTWDRAVDSLENVLKREC